MQYHVDSYDKTNFYHNCTAETGETFHIDIQVNGDLEKDLPPEDLVGKTIEIGSLLPCFFIGVDVKITRTPE